MVIKDPIVLRQLQNRNWITPALGLRRLQVLSSIADSLPEVGGSRNWREGPFRKYWEEYQAALFCYGLEQAAYRATGFRPSWQFSYGEKAALTSTGKHDGIVSRCDDSYIRCAMPDVAGGWGCKPLQLKELPPTEVNPHVSLQDLLNSLVKYSSDVLVVGIYINRPSMIRFSQLTAPKLRIEQLWLYGFLENEKAFIVGDLLGDARRYEFDYPLFPFPASLTGG